MAAVLPGLAAGVVFPRRAAKGQAAAALSVQGMLNDTPVRAGRPNCHQQQDVKCLPIDIPCDCPHPQGVDVQHLSQANLDEKNARVTHIQSVAASEPLYHQAMFEERDAEMAKRLKELPASCKVVVAVAGAVSATAAAMASQPQLHTCLACCRVQPATHRQRGWGDPHGRGARCNLANAQHGL